MPTVEPQSKSAHVLRVNAPEWYTRPDFLKYLNGKGTATFHTQGNDPSEYSDIFMPFDSDSPEEGALPDDISQTLFDLWRAAFGTSPYDQYGVIWISNLPGA